MTQKSGTEGTGGTEGAEGTGGIEGAKGVKDADGIEGAGGTDGIDRLISTLAQTHDPALLEAKALAYRLRRVAHRLETELKRELAPHGIELWELELLACLLRAPQRQLTAGALATEMQLTSGAVSNRVGRLEAKGWLVRDFAPHDRRSVTVTLTAEGAARAEEVFATKTETELRLLSALSAERQHRLNNDLRTVLLALKDGEDD
ncbi:MarR family transcriptional regulator [Streptomyces sp. NBC_01387]|uniref:MarR family winged helix-turn-helix transcriptional regulator n=1 Tax=unclassified Streptomyces TaxID=2593676 RepID=UPI002250E28F|nr:MULTISPECIES: MarR family transcriptional regulator [unclassified Streptomyces]MCX4550286.1 MarR family transcriptional regulator [Streptomyces sp. NBC_01500]WSC21781.1 MarR family transcriptional regulator [Streptomyces sp. NBC_01766]WSV55739.1 MarR family transcriptional regulator [Streptomyces sp. NBC_01014]